MVTAYTSPIWYTPAGWRRAARIDCVPTRRGLSHTDQTCDPRKNSQFLSGARWSAVSAVPAGASVRGCARDVAAADRDHRVSRLGTVVAVVAVIRLCGGDRVAIPFLYDIEAHVRFLVALPILIAAELVVHLRLLPIVRRFVERRIVSPEEMPRISPGHRVHLAPAQLGNLGSPAPGAGLRAGLLGVANPVRSWCAQLVCGHGWNTAASHTCRVLVCVRESANLSVHPAAVVFAPFLLVLVSVPGFEAEAAPHSTPPGQDRRSRVF